MRELVVLSGAGMSADSGLKTFRDSGGLWEGVDIRDVATVEAWKRNPQRVLSFYNERRAQSYRAQPNEGHKMLAALENDFDVTIITQNVDSLHERAGSSHVLHLHGELSKVRSEDDPANIIHIGGDSIGWGDTASDGAQLRPHVVWFGEAVPKMKEALQIIPTADILVVIGTSLVVYPAAGLIDHASPEIPKYIVDPAEPALPDLHQWTHIAKRAAIGVPQLADHLTN